MVNDGGTPETTYYVYDAGGQRVRKVTERPNGATRKDERIYLGGFEIYREYDGDGTTSRWSARRCTSWTTSSASRWWRRARRATTAHRAQLIRYQFGNHLGSASLELDDQAQIISYEEYYPYGSTSYQAVRSQTETPKRYRYTGKERDEESGLYYHGARYYAPWLGRWMSCDPAGLVDGVNLFRYCRNNPNSICGSRTVESQRSSRTKNRHRQSYCQNNTVVDTNCMTNEADPLRTPSVEANRA